MIREESGELQPGQRLQDRPGRVWTVTSKPFRQRDELTAPAVSGSAKLRPAVCVLPPAGGGVTTLIQS
jgi:hypothetical protein